MPPCGRNMCGYSSPCDIPGIRKGLKDRWLPPLVPPPAPVGVTMGRSPWPVFPSAGALPLLPLTSFLLWPPGDGASAILPSEEQMGRASGLWAGLGGAVDEDEEVAAAMVAVATVKEAEEEGGGGGGGGGRLAHQPPHAEHVRLHGRHAVEHHGKHAQAALGVLAGRGWDGCEAVGKSHQPCERDARNVPQALQAHQVHAAHQAVHEERAHAWGGIRQQRPSFRHLATGPPPPPPGALSRGTPAPSGCA